MSKPLTITKQQRKSLEKSIREAQSGAFLCQLVYFTVKICTILIFYNFKNILWEDYQLLVWFMFLLCMNTYLMLMTGRNPGYETVKITKEEWGILLRQDKIKNPVQTTEHNNETQQDEEQSINSYQDQFEVKQNHIQNTISDSYSADENISSSFSDNIILIDNYCKFCQCIKRNRMKHCYSCGKCVMKHDHHCPWIGACVGELNHFMFVICLLAHTLQAVTTLYVILKSLHFYQYYDQQTDTYNTEYGVYMLWSVFMVMYIFFAGGLLLFHSYLIMANVTTRQLVNRKKCAYLKDIKGNPFDEGLIRNIKLAICTEEKGRLWKVKKEIDNQSQKSKHFWEKLFRNKYYECC